MSATLLKRSLELVDTPYVAVTTEKKGKSKSQIDSSNQYTCIKPLHKSKKEKHQRGVADIQNKNLTAIKKAKKSGKVRKNKGSQNKRKLKLLHRGVINEKWENILAERFLKGIIKKEEAAKEETTAFTEEDFRRFEKEFME